MNRLEKEKPRPDVAASEREAEQRNTGKAFSVSMNDFITGSKGKQSFVDRLPHDPANAITAAQLGEMLEMSPRDVTKAIQHYRLYGVPICASCGAPHGYFIADKPETLTRYIKSLDGRLREVQRTREAMVNTLDRMSGQQRMEGF